MGEENWEWDREGEISSKALGHSQKYSAHRWILDQMLNRRKICKKSIRRDGWWRHRTLWWESHDEQHVVFSASDHWKRVTCEDVQLKQLMLTNKPFEWRMKGDSSKIYIKDHPKSMTKMDHWSLRSDGRDEQRTKQDWSDWLHSSKANNAQHREEDTDDDEEWWKKRDYLAERRRKVKGKRKSVEISSIAFAQKKDP